MNSHYFPCLELPFLNPPVLQEAVVLEKFSFHHRGEVPGNVCTYTLVDLVQGRRSCDLCF